MELQVNMTAIVVAVVVNFIIGALWFMPLFGKAWGVEMKMDTAEKPDPKVMMRGMLYMVIGNFLFAWVFAHNIAAWSFVPDMATTSKSASAMMAAVFTWLGFYLPGQLGATVWEKHSWKLFAINTGYSLVSLIVVAFILCLWPA